jgi:hypothetical protein
MDADDDDVLVAVPILDKNTSTSSIDSINRNTTMIENVPTTVVVESFTGTIALPITNCHLVSGPVPSYK